MTIPFGCEYNITIGDLDVPKVGDYVVQRVAPVTLNQISPWALYAVNDRGDLTPQRPTVHAGLKWTEAATFGRRLSRAFRNNDGTLPTVWRSNEMSGSMTQSMNVGTWSTYAHSLVFTFNSASRIGVRR